MKDFFKELFEYGHHFNQELGSVLINNPDKVSERLVKLYSHILNAHQIWNNRIEPKEKTFGVWQIQSVQDGRSIDKTNYERTLLILEHADLTHIIKYTNSKGETFSNNVRDILFHVINHSTYHRAQIATEFKQCGLDPLVTDYIFYKR